MSHYSRGYNERIVVPGEAIATIEEFIPGPGTFVDEEKGVIRAVVKGRVHYNMATRIVEVKPLVELRVPRPGSSAVGLVMQVRNDIVLVELYGEIRLQPTPSWVYEYTGKFLGGIPISNVSEEYVKDLEDYYRPGDIVLVKVLNSTNPYNLSTVDPPYGVIYAECSRCGSLLEPVNTRNMKCPRCGRTEKRKVSVLASSKLLRILLKRHIVSYIR